MVLYGYNTGIRLPVRVDVLVARGLQTSLRSLLQIRTDQIENRRISTSHSTGGTLCLSFIVNIALIYRVSIRVRVSVRVKVSIM